jgi:hypothetical protein
MRFLRFSIRRLLILTGLVAAVLYLSIVRPVAVAKQYILTKRQTESELITRKSFGNQFTDEANIEGQLGARTWEDLFKCRQRFTIKIAQETSDNQMKVAYLDFCATPIGVREVYPSVLMVKDGE